MSTDEIPFDTDEDITENLPMNLEEEMAKELATLTDQTGDGGTPLIKIGPGGEFLEIPGVGAAGTEVDLIIVGQINRKEYYKGKYNANKIVPPTCFGFGYVKHNNLTPHEGSATPMCETCKDCELNVWEQGSPKECKDMVWLVCVAPDDPHGQLALIRVSPTGLTSWRAHVRNTKAKFNLPVIGVYTKVGIQQAGNSDRHTFKFGFGGKNPRVPHETLAVVMARREEAKPILERVYTYD